MCKQKENNEESRSHSQRPLAKKKVLSKPGGLTTKIVYNAFLKTLIGTARNRDYAIVIEPQIQTDAN